MQQEISNSNNNIAHYLSELAATQPYKRAVVQPEKYNKNGKRCYSHYTFQQLNERSDFIAWGLQNLGIKNGDKVLLMVRPELELFAITFAIFKLGAVPVMIDPGMGWKGFLRCVQQVQPGAFIGIPAAHIVRIFNPSAFKSIRTLVTWGKRFGWGGKSIAELSGKNEPFETSAKKPSDTAAILFTSGSTGPAKGVVYTHRIFNTQVEIMRETYKINSNDIDLPCFTLFGLFSVALGATAVIPDLNPAKPITVDPQKIIETIQDQGITYSFGSPAIWQKVTSYAIDNKITCPTLRQVLVAGAPIHANLHRKFYQSLLTEDANIFTPYGATESLPVANISGKEVLAETAELTAQGKGICVGKPLNNIEMKIIKISDEAIPTWSEDLTVTQGEIGEICVRGPVVTKEYYQHPEGTAKSKIYDGETWFHRIGDVGYFDEQGRLWFCGRKGHRVETANNRYFSICTEAIANNHSAVLRSALAAKGTKYGEQKPVIFIELKKDNTQPIDQITKEVKELYSQAHIDCDIIVHPAFPVDVRHNAKINRELLSKLANQ